MLEPQADFHLVPSLGTQAAPYAALNGLVLLGLWNADQGIMARLLAADASFTVHVVMVVLLLDVHCSGPVKQLPHKVMDWSCVRT